MTHALRAAHDAILVGIGVLADNQRLTVRLVDGASPRPVVLDSKLRMPPDANLMTHPAGVVIATNGHDSANDRRRCRPKARPCSICPPQPGRSTWFAQVAGATGHPQRHGGRRQPSSTAFCAQLVDYLLVTVAPTFLGGVRRSVRPHRCRPGCSPSRRRATQTLGDDIIISGVPRGPAVPALKADAMPAMSTPSPRRSLYFVAAGEVEVRREPCPRPRARRSAGRHPSLRYWRGRGAAFLPRPSACRPARRRHHRGVGRPQRLSAQVRLPCVGRVTALGRRWTRRGTGAPSSPSSPTKSPISPPGRRS
ncbi:MAG: dihydrofolate reductase family protein [Caldilineaceae bacterium]